MIVVTLTEREIAMAKAVGRRRNAENLAAGRDNAHGLAAGLALETNQLGCLGEAAAAKGLNLFWGEWERFRAIDVGGRVEVRTVTKAGRHLILHKTDRDDLPFLLVDLSDMPTARLLGWVFGCDGKRLGQWRTDVRSPCYFVPQGLLRASEELRRLCHQCEVEGF